MFLDVPGLAFKRMRFNRHSFIDGPVKSEASGNQKPNYLVSLGDSMWPEAVIEQIAQMFKAIDLQDPRRQKLIEPYAVAFGGKNRDGELPLLACKANSVLIGFLKTNGRQH